MAKQIIETEKVLTVASLIETLQSFSTVDPETIFVKGPNGYDVRVSLEETTLTDGSLVYDVLVTEEAFSDGKGLKS